MAREDSLVVPILVLSQQTLPFKILFEKKLLKITSSLSKITVQIMHITYEAHLTDV